MGKQKKHTGRACVLLQEYVRSKQRKRTIEADDRLCCEPNSVTTWFVPLGHFSEQIDPSSKHGASNRGSAGR